MKTIRIHFYEDYYVWCLVNLKAEGVNGILFWEYFAVENLYGPV
jgi:hypothetical protein